MRTAAHRLIGAIALVCLLAPATATVAQTTGPTGGEVPPEALAPAPTSTTGVPGANDDDGDGLSNADERSGVRNPWPSGLVGIAVAGDPTDPHVADSDGDGLSDGQEIGSPSTWRGGYATDPNRADTDADGRTDGDEIGALTDPRGPDADVAADGGTSPGADVVHFDDVPGGAFFHDAAYWAVGAGIAGVPPRFRPELSVPRWQMAVFLRRYAGHLGRPVTAAAHSYRDLGAVGRQARAAIGWASANGILRGPTATRFAPDRTITRGEVALTIFRFAVWAGHPAVTSPGANPYSDMVGIALNVRGAIGWLHSEGIPQATGFINGAQFGPRRGMNRGQTVTFLLRLDDVISVEDPTGDTDGDGVFNLDEQQGRFNPYPVDPGGGDINPISPGGQCLAPGSPFLDGDLPPTPPDPRLATDPDDPDSDDDGLTDGEELLELETDPNDADTDNDCLTDNQEHVGINLVVDEDGQGCPGGGGGGCPGLTRYIGYSNPLVTDTDEDDLPDHEEWLLRTDAERVDTDTDGLNDFDEWNQWFTSPLSVDSDQDARGGGGNLPPTESMFDGIELRDVGTSPTLDDTDGDGANDADELDSPVRSPLLAELPEFEMQLEGGTSVRLVKERSAEQGGALAVGLADSVASSRTSGTSSSITQRETHSIGVEAGFEFGYDDGIVAKGSLNLSYGYEWGTDRTRDFSQEESAEISQERSRTEEESWTTVEAAARGEISQGMVFRNTGTFTYELSSIAYTILLRNPDTLTFDVVGTMTVPFDGITLAPGASTPPIQVEAEDVNVELIEQFLQSPSSLHFATGNIEFLDSEGRNFEFVTEQTFARTAQVVVDFGGLGPEATPRLEQYSIATNVDRDPLDEPDWGLRNFPGIRMGGRTPDQPAYQQGVMDQIGYPRCDGDVPTGGCYTTTPDGDLASVDGIANVESGGGDCRATWVVTTESEQDVDDLAFDDLVLKAGETLRLTRQTDCDGDGLTDGIEPMLGACVETPTQDDDCDDDGLSDLAEVEGWIVGLPDPSVGGDPCSATGPPPAPGTDPLPLWATDTLTCPWTSSNPALPDSDGDGLDDREERDGVGRQVAGTPLDERTDPQDVDSDADGFPDCSPDPGDGECVGNVGDPAPLHSSVRRVDATPCGLPNGCWDAPMTDLAAALDVTAANADGDPRNDVRSIWVAEGPYTAPASGFVLPAGVGVFGGFLGNELRRTDRNPDPASPHATRLVGGAGTAPVVEVLVDEVVFDGFRVEGGEHGGVRGFAADDAVLRNLRIVNNSEPAQCCDSVAAGGVTWQLGHGLTLSNSTVASNTGPVGGVRIWRSDDATIEQSVIRNNYSDGDLRPTDCDTSPAPSCEGGGGLSVFNSTVTLDRSVVTDNNALVGGGIDVSTEIVFPTDHRSVVRVVSSEVTRNTAQGDDSVVGRGGGVHVRDADLLLSNCLVADNRTVVGPRWAADPSLDGFGGGVFAHDGADVQVINCTVAGNAGAGVLVASDEEGFGAPGTNHACGDGTAAGGATTLPYDCTTVEGATATFRNSVFYGNEMDWQPTSALYAITATTCTDLADCLGPLRTVGSGLLGFNEESTGTSLFQPCLGVDKDEQFPPFGGFNLCIYNWFTGLGSSSSTEVRTDDAPGQARALSSMIGAGSRHGAIDIACTDLEYFGRTEVPTVAFTRGTTRCGTTNVSNLWVGLRGRGYVGGQTFPVLPPPTTATLGDFYALPGYALRPDAVAVGRGNQDVDWDPFAPGIQDAPELDLAGQPRVVGAQIDLGAYELQP